MNALIKMVNLPQLEISLVDFSLGLIEARRDFQRRAPSRDFHKAKRFANVRIGDECAKSGDEMSRKKAVAIVDLGQTIRKDDKDKVS